MAYVLLGTGVVLVAVAVAAALAGLPLGDSIVAVEAFGVLAMLLGAWFHVLADPNQGKFDPYSPDHLELIVDHLSEQPIRYQQDLAERISNSRASLEASSEELPKLMKAIDLELARTPEQELGLLLMARKSAAEAVAERIGRLLQDFDRQLSESEEAVAPLLNLRERFVRLRRIGEALERIQAVSSKADAAEDGLAQTRAELSALKQVTDAALVRLEGVHRHLEQLEAAKDEIGQLQLNA